MAYPFSDPNRITVGFDMLEQITFVNKNAKLPKLKANS